MYSPGPVHDRFIHVNPANEGRALRRLGAGQRIMSGDAMVIRMVFVLAFVTALVVFLLVTTAGDESSSAAPAQAVTDSLRGR